MDQGESFEVSKNAMACGCICVHVTSWKNQRERFSINFIQTFHSVSSSTTAYGISINTTSEQALFIAEIIVKRIPVSMIPDPTNLRTLRPNEQAGIKNEILLTITKK